MIRKEDVIEFLVSEGYANNPVSAEVIHEHISDEFLAEIEELIEASNQISPVGPHIRTIPAEGGSRKLVNIHTGMQPSGKPPRKGFAD